LTLLPIVLIIQPKVKTCGKGVEKEAKSELLGTGKGYPLAQMAHPRRKRFIRTKNPHQGNHTPDPCPI
jgi:hypothetical protein